MKIIEIEGSKVLRDERNNFRNYLSFLQEGGKQLENENLVLDLQQVENLDTKELLNLLPYSENHKVGRKSFVVVTTDVDIEEVPEDLSIVPTLGEAVDLIQMEEIERDLEF